MRFRVRFAETDQMGIAHHSSYVIWFEAARVEWLRERGLSYRELEEQGVSLAVSGLTIAYRSPALFDDELELEARLVEARTRRFRYDYRLVRPADSVLIATGSTLHIPMDRQGRAIRLAEHWMQHMRELLDD